MRVCASKITIAIKSSQLMFELKNAEKEKPQKRKTMVSFAFI